MGNGAWSNDQLNSIFIYSAGTGRLILSVDDTGFLYNGTANNGSYVKLQTNLDTPIPSTAVRLQPPNSADPDVVYKYPGDIFATEFVGSGGRTHGELLLFSPQIGELFSSYLSLGSQSIEGGAASQDDTSITLNAGFMYGPDNSDISQGMVDFAAQSFTATIGGTEVVFDWMGGPNSYGRMVASRLYTVRFVGTIRSTSAGDRVRCRIYSGPNNNNLTGATLLGDTGTTTIAVAGVDQPWSAEWSFTGAPGKYLLLATQRVSGAGTPSLTTNSRAVVDVFPINAYA